MTYGQNAPSCDPLSDQAGNAYVLTMQLVRWRIINFLLQNAFIIDK